MEKRLKMRVKDEKTQVFRVLLGVRVAELQALPLQLFEKLAEVLNLVEEKRMWPVPVTRSLVALIP